MKSAVLFSFLLIPLILVSSASPPQPPPSISCSNELVSFSNCLSYAVNNGTDSPSPKCCDDISEAFLNNSTVCLCYFIRQPDIMGFPINATKVMSLTTVCSINDGISGDLFSIQTLCSGTTALPPLNSITGIPANSPPLPTANSSQLPDVGSSNEQEPADELPTQPGSSVVQGAVSSATEMNIKLSFILIALFVYIFVVFEFPLPVLSAMNSAVVNHKHAMIH